MAKRKRHASVPFEKIIVDDAFNSRTSYEKIEELAESIMHNGLLTDLGGSFHSDGEHVFLIYGFRRYKAIEHIRSHVNEDAFNEVPFVILDEKPSKLRICNFVENLDREQLSNGEISNYIYRLVNTGMDQRTIANQIGRPQSWVSYRYKIKKELCPVGWDAYSAGDLPVDLALHLADMSHEDQQKTLLKMEKLSSRSERSKLVKAEASAKGNRRAYTNKGRPTAKNLTSFVDQVSFKATAPNVKDKTQSFLNGVAAGLRIAVGDVTYEKLRSNSNYLDTDFSGAAAAAAEKAAREAEKQKAKEAAKAAKAAAREAAKAAKDAAKKSGVGKR